MNTFASPQRQEAPPASSLSSLGSSSMNQLPSLNMSTASTSNHSTTISSWGGGGETAAAGPPEMNAQPFWILDETNIGKNKKKQQSNKKGRPRMGLFSKMFSASRRGIRDTNTQEEAVASQTRKTRKSVQLPQDPPESPAATTDITWHLSRDATQVFEELREKESKRDKSGMRREKSNDSLLGSVLEIPAHERAKSNNNSNNKSRHSSIINKSQPYCNTDDHDALPSTALPPQKSYRVTSANTSNEQRVARSPKKATSFRVARSSSSSRVSRLSSSARDLTRDLSVRSFVEDSFHKNCHCANEMAHHSSHMNQHPDEKSKGAHTFATGSSPSQQIEIAPGVSLPLRGSQETLRYVRKQKIAEIACLACGESVHAIQDASMVLCPTCRSVTPLDPDNGNGLALGFATWDLRDIQKAAFAI